MPNLRDECGVLLCVFFYGLNEEEEENQNKLIQPKCNGYTL